MIESDLLKYNIENKRILFTDSETESLNLKFARPWDISFVTYHGYKKIEEKQFYIKWKNLNIPQDLANKIHYNKEKVDALGLEPEVAAHLILSYLNNPENDIISGNNLLNYDCMIFYNACKLCNINLGYDFLHKIYDCNSIFKGYKRGLKPDHRNFLAWQFGQNNFVQKGLRSSVSYICKDFGLEHNEEELHGSLADTLLSAQIFFKLIKKIDVK